VIPLTLAEAFALLASNRGEARVVAGGTDLVIQLQQRDRSGVRCLVDITRIPGLDQIRAEDSHLIVGATVTFAQLESSALIRTGAPVLAEAAGWVGSPQIRSVGTLAGNVVNAQPAADGAIALAALDAQVQITRSSGSQWVPLASLYAGPGVSTVDPTSEIVTAFRFPAHGPREGSAFERLARRKALALPLINVGACVQLDAAGASFRCVRIAAGPVAPIPFRAEHAEAVLKNRPVTDEVIAEAADIAAGECKPRSSLLRAGREYRQELVRVLTRRALFRATQRAKGH
jgi:carbon-monoxide dehydrogenase medium subunit